MKRYKGRKIKFHYVILMLIVFACLLTDFLSIARYKFSATVRIAMHHDAMPKHNITYILDGGDQAENQKESFGESDLPYTLLEPTKIGYRFMGWYDNAEFTGSEITAITTEADITLYAKWELGIAELDGVIYNTVHEAVQQVEANNVEKTITLLGCSRESIAIVAGQKIVLNLNKPIYYLCNANNNAIISNKGTLNILNGQIKTNANNGAAIDNMNGGKLTVNGTKVTVTETGGQAIYNEKSTVEITGTTYLTSASGPNALKNRATVQSKEGATLIITGGTIESTGNQPAINNEGNMRIGTKDGNMIANSPVIKGITYGVHSTKNFEFYDGIIKGVNGGIEDETKAATLETNYLLNSGTEVIDGVTYYTSFLEACLKVTFDANGGTATETERYLESGSVLGELPSATKPYNTFLGWFTDPTDGTQITGDEIITSHVTYYAHWSSYTIRITFDPNGGTVLEEHRDITAGDPIGSLPVPEKTDEDFAGWYTDPDDGDRIEQTSFFGEDTILYAHWGGVNSVAKIGLVYYESVNAAIASTNNTLTTITLVKDTLEAVEIARGKNIIIDLNNHIIRNDGTKKTKSNEYVAMENKGTVTIKNGTVTGNTSSATINNLDTGTLIINNVNIIQTNTSKKKQALHNNGGTVEIYGTTQIQACNGDAYNGIDRGAIQNLNSGTMKIFGGTITSSTSHAIVNQAGSTLEIGTKDGDIDATTPVIIGEKQGVQNAGTFNFYDGIIKGKTTAIYGSIEDQEDNSVVVEGTESGYYTKHLEASE